MISQSNNIRYAEAFTVELYMLDGLPGGISGTVIKAQEPQRYKIGLNADATEIQRLATFLHEVIHIYNHDLDTGGDVAEIEARTHRQLLEALELLKKRDMTVTAK